MLSSMIIPHSIYNTLPEIEHQPRPAKDDLLRLGRIFVDYGLNDVLGVALLHRHCLLEDGEVMLHNGLRCAPVKPTIELQLVGKAFHFHDDKWLPFEYDNTAGERFDVSETFSQDLMRCFKKCGLNRQFALTRLNGSNESLMEHCEDGRAQVCEVTDAAIPPEDAVEWRFDNVGDQIVPVIVRGCPWTIMNTHKRK